MAGYRKRPRFRAQTLGGLLAGITRALFSGTTRPARPARSAAAMADGDLPAGSIPAPAARGPITVILSIVALVVVAAVAASIVILVRLFGSANEGVVHISIPNAATATPAGPATPPPLATLAVPAGTRVSAARIFGGQGGVVLLSPQEALRQKDGKIYVADAGNHRVAVLDGKGRLIGAITRAMNDPLQAPFSLAITPRGHLLVLDSDAGAVIEYDGAGAPVQQSAPSLSLVHSRGIAVDAAGHVLVADPAANAIYTLGSDLALQHTQGAASGSGGAHIFDQPSAVATGPGGAIFVMDSQNNRIDRFSSDWQLQFTYPLVPTDTLHPPHMLPLADGRLLVTDPPGNKLLLFGPADAQPVAFSLGGSSPLPCASPLGLAADRLPAVLITCNGSGQLWQVRVPGL